MTRVGRSGWIGFALFATAAGCRPATSDGPPEVRYGESVCATCGMIVSDERFATASMIDGDRGPEPRFFDDFNCQKDFERQHPSVVVLTRWVHDYGSFEWLPAETAHYVRAASLRTPMASGVVAFAAPQSAEMFARDVGGVVVAFSPPSEERPSAAP